LIPILHQTTKFRNDWSNRCGDIAIFVIFNVAAAILDFQKFEILTSVRCSGPIGVIMPNFIKILQTVAEVGRFNGFFKMAAVRHFGLVGRDWDHPR